MFGNLREDLVLDQRVLRADLLVVEGGVKSLLCFDARSASKMSYVIKIQQLLILLTKQP